MHRPLLLSSFALVALVALGCTNEGSEFESDPLTVCTDQVGCPEGSRCIQGLFCETVQPIEPGGGMAIAPTFVVVVGPGGIAPRDAGVGQGDGGLDGQGDAGLGTPSDGGVFGSCGEGQLSCSGVCADAQSDPNNCGSCGNACSGAELCQQGVCCDPVRTVCGGACADLTNDRNNCGVCGLVCAAGAECVLGACREQLPGTTPDPGFGD